MRYSARLTLSLAALVGLAAPTLVEAQAMASAEPFKVGTFEINGAPAVGLVLRDQLIVDVNAANAALELDPAYVQVAMPADMLGLIGQYEYGLKYRLYEIVNHLVENDPLSARNRPAYVHDVDDIGFLPPIMYPGKILNAAVNFYSHVDESGTEEERTAARRARRENRGVPYLFLKPSRGAVVGNGHEVVIPWGRDRTDWEVELGAVIGRTAKYVSAEDAQDYVFGYMVTIDVSDRGGRPPGGFGSGSDWFVGKGHDTFAPQGPWIVPKEFYGDPMQNLRQTLSVGGQMLQEARAGDMIHSLWELIEYGSSIITLFPGDVLNNGTSGGTSMSAGAGSTTTSAQRTGSLYLQAGEVMEATIDGIGTLRMPVVAEPEPAGGTDSRLPPVNTYRRN
jgi:2-keto-4-pentenoate hydratase/2-oxohepta-3-ene-1,7-dioic acid hydratase in catechol pathway